jgi:hypothetical protein
MANGEWLTAQLNLWGKGSGAYGLIEAMLPCARGAVNGQHLNIQEPRPDFLRCHITPRAPNCLGATAGAPEGGYVFYASVWFRVSDIAMAAVAWAG